MATSLASSLVWGSGNAPTIYIDISYDASRSGADMVYTVYLTARKPSGTYGYNIKANVTFDGGNSTTFYIKQNSTSSWSSYSNNTGSKTVSNKTSGTTSLRVEVWSDNAGTSRDTVWTYSLPVSAAGSAISASNGTLEVQQAISLTRYSSGFTDTVTYTCGSASGTIGTISSGGSQSINWTPPASLALQNTTGNTLSCTVTTTTKSGSTTVGSKSATISLTIPNTATFKPTASMTLSDANGYASTFGGYYIQGESQLRAALTGSGKQNATISSYTVIAGNTSYTGQSPFTFPAFADSGSITVSATATDSRGKVSDAVTQQITVLPYASPVISSTSVTRCNASGTPQADGDYVVLTMNAASATPIPATGTNKNTVTYRVRYKASSATSYSTYTWYTDVTTTSVGNLSTPISGTGYPISLAASDTMDVVFEVLDKFETTQATRNVPVAGKLFDVRKHSGGDGFAIGRISTDADFEVAKDTVYYADVQHDTAGAGVFAETYVDTESPGTGLVDLIYPVGSIYMSVNNTNPSMLFGGTWEQIQDKFLLASGSSHAAGSTGGRENVTLAAWIGASAGAASSLAYQAGNANSHMGTQTFNGYRFTGLTYSSSRGGSWNHNTWVTDMNQSTRETNIMPPYLSVYVWKRVS